MHCYLAEAMTKLKVISVLFITTILLSADFKDLGFIFPFGKDVKVRIVKPFRRIGCHPSTWVKVPISALDISVASGTPIGAIGQGKVIEASYSRGYGNWVAIQHNDSIVSHYYHMSEIAVDSAQQVVKGQVIGKVGNTGLSSAPHLRLSVLLNSKRVHPCLFIPCDRVKSESSN